MQTYISCVLHSQNVYHTHTYHYLRYLRGSRNDHGSNIRSIAQLVIYAPIKVIVALEKKRIHTPAQGTGYGAAESSAREVEQRRRHNLQVGPWRVCWCA
jgi:hypothetical protein